MLLHQGNINTFYGDFLSIHWDPTRLCNYRCSYCGNSDKQPAQSDWLDLDRAKCMFDNLLATNRTSYLISIAGGEPTFYPYLIPVLEHIGETYKNKLNYLSIISNGSRDISFYERIAFLSQSIPILLTISIHLERANLDHIKMILDTVASNTSLCFNLMFHPGFREKITFFHEQMLEWRKDYPFGMSISLLRELKNGNIIDRRYNYEDMEWQAKATKEFSLIHSSSYKKYIRRGILDTSTTCWSTEGDRYSYERIWDMNEQLKRGVCNLKNKFCVQGTYVVYIGPDGYAQNAICFQAARSSKAIYECPPFDDDKFCRVIQCNQTVCGCGANNNLQKFDNINEANDYIQYFQLNKKNRENDLSLIKQLKERNNICASILARINPRSLQIDEFIDQPYYFSKYPDVAQSGMSAYEHWSKYGWKEKRNPAPWFDTTYYLSQYHDFEKPDIDPLVHYILKGVLQGKLPYPEI